MPTLERYCNWKGNKNESHEIECFAEYMETSFRKIVYLWCNGWCMVHVLQTFTKPKNSLLYLVFSRSEF
jgi:hypothetical protein